LAWGAAALVGQALVLGGLPGDDPLSELVEFGAGQPGQGGVGQLLDDPRSLGCVVAGQEGEQVGGGAESDWGDTERVAVILQDTAGLFDQVTDADVADFQQVGHHFHGAGLPLVEEGEQQTRGIVEQGCDAEFSGGAAGPASALIAVSFLGADSLGGASLAANCCS
jgi:hypothetical protein